MNIWALFCWALDIPKGEMVSYHPTFENALDAAVAWVEADRVMVPQMRSVYTLVEWGTEGTVYH